MRKACQTGSFSKTYKKLHEKELCVLVKEIERVCEDPEIGVRKNGVLARVWVHKFKQGKQRMLLAYIPTQDCVTFVAYGSHENFYRDLTR